MGSGQRRRLILASGSPRRHQLLQTIGLEFDVEVADVDESELPGETPTVYVERVGRSKALAVVARLGLTPGDDVIVLAADTTVDIDDEILPKPLDDDDARRMLASLSGRTHQVHTAVVAWHRGQIRAVTVTTDVTFARLDGPVIEWYLSFGEHLDKAGAYGMQSAGGALVERIDGSPTNVIGLPLMEAIDLLRACGSEVGRGRPDCD